jgi:hypothetical protein
MHFMHKQISGQNQLLPTTLALGEVPEVLEQAGADFFRESRSLYGERIMTLTGMPLDWRGSSATSFVIRHS